jgi:hypothetical protein
VWDYIVDPDRHLEFMDGMTRWQVEGAKRTGLGARFAMLRVTYHAPGGIMGSVADLAAWPIVRGHLQRSLETLKHRVETRPPVRSELEHASPHVPARRSQNPRA